MKCGSAANTFVIRGRLPQHLDHHDERDKPLIRLLAQINGLFSEHESDLVQNMAVIPGLVNTLIPRKNWADQVSKPTYRVNRHNRQAGRREGIAADAMAYVANLCQSSYPKPFAQMRMHSRGLTAERQQKNKVATEVEYWKNAPSRPPVSPRPDSPSREEDHQEQQPQPQPFDDDYKVPIVTKRADTPDGQHWYDEYWRRVMLTRSVEFSGFIDAVWARRKHNDLVLHGSRYCVVFDYCLEARTGRAHTASALATRRFDVVVHPAHRGQRHATNTLQRVVMGLLSKPGVTVQAMTSTQQTTSPIVKILKQIPCNVSQAGNMWTFTPHTPEAAQPCVPSQPPDDPSKSPARAKLRRGLHARADQMGVDREKVTWKVPSGVDGWNPDLVLPGVHPTNDPVRVLGADLGEKADQYVVDVAHIAAQELQRLAKLKPSTTPKQSVQDDIAVYRQKAERLKAHAVLSSQSTITGVRTELHAMHHHDMMKIRGERVAPRLSKVVDTISTAIETVSTVQTTSGTSGEATWWSLEHALPFGYLLLEDVLACSAEPGLCCVLFDRTMWKQLKRQYIREKKCTTCTDLAVAKAILCLDSSATYGREQVWTNDVSQAVQVVVAVPGWPNAAGAFRQGIDHLNKTQLESRRRRQATRKSAESNPGRKSAPIPNKLIDVIDVHSMCVAIMFDHGERHQNRKRDTTAAATAGPLESGSTITIAKLVDAKHLVESTNYNAVPVAQHTGKDSAKLIAEYWGHGLLDSIAAVKASTHSWGQKVYTASGPNLRSGFKQVVHFGISSDGAGRRENGGWSARSENPCEHCTACGTHMKGQPLRFICKPRIIRDVIKYVDPCGRVADDCRRVWSTDRQSYHQLDESHAHVRPGMKTHGILLRLFSMLDTSVLNLNKELAMSQVMPYFETVEDIDDGEVQISDGKQWAPVYIQFTRHAVQRLEDRFSGINAWLNGKSLRYLPKKLREVKNQYKDLLLSLRTGGCVKVDYESFLADIAREISKVDAEFRTYSNKTNKVPCRGIVGELDVIIKVAFQTETELAAQRLACPSSRLFDDAIGKALEVITDGVPLVESNWADRPVNTLRALGDLREKAKAIMTAVKHEIAQQKTDRPVLTTDIHTDLHELLHAMPPKSPADPRGYSLYRMKAGNKVKMHLQRVSGGQHGPVFLDELMKLEILHLLPVRGYGTIFSAIGVKAWVHGLGLGLIKGLNNFGVAAHYYEKYDTLHFAPFAKKGYDSIRVMADPYTAFAGLPQQPENKMSGLFSGAVDDWGSQVIHLITCWHAMWLIVSCPYLRDKDYIIGECLTTWTQQRDTVLAGEMAIRRFAETGYRIACGIFGSTVMTGNNHTVFKDLAPAFADADGKLYMYCAQAIERCQQIARELGIRASSDPSPHTAVLKRWIAGLTANSDITSASAQSKKNGARTRKQWKVRADQLAKATELLDRFYRLPDGRYMNDPDKLWAPHMPTYSPLDEFSNAYGRTNRGRPLASELAMHNANVAASGFGSRLAVVEQESAASEKKQKKQKKQKNQNQKGKPQTPVAEEVTTTSASAASAAAATSAAAAAAAADVTTAAAAAATAARFNVGVASPPRKRVAKKAPAQKRSSGSEDTVSRGRKSARGGDSSGRSPLETPEEFAAMLNPETQRQVHQMQAKTQRAAVGHGSDDNDNDSSDDDGEGWMEMADGTTVHISELAATLKTIGPKKRTRQQEAIARALAHAADSLGTPAAAAGANSGDQDDWISSLVGDLDDMDNAEDGLGRLCSDSSDSSDSETESDEDAHGDDDVEDADMEEDTPPETLPAVALGEVRPGSLVAYMVQQNRQSDPATGGEEGHIGMRQADIVVGANIEFLLDSFSGGSEWFTGTVQATDTAESECTVLSDDDGEAYCGICMRTRIRSLSSRRRVRVSAQLAKALQSEKEDWAERFDPGQPGNAVARKGLLEWGMATSVGRSEHQAVEYIVVNPLMKMSQDGFYKAVGGGMHWEDNTATSVRHKVLSNEVLVHAGRGASEMKKDRSRAVQIQCVFIAGCDRVDGVERADIWRRKNDQTED